MTTVPSVISFSFFFEEGGVGEMKEVVTKENKVALLMTPTIFLMIQECIESWWSSMRPCALYI